MRIANYESKLLWPDVEEYHPDILLSVGTGHNGADTKGFVDATHIDRRRYHTRSVLKKPRPKDLQQKDPQPKDSQPQRNHLALWALPEVNAWVNVLFRRVDNILDSEAIWRSFQGDLVGSSSFVHAQRYERVNPQIRFPTPRMDDKSQIEKLYEDVHSRLESPYMHAKITRIAYRLVASCFYFEKTGPSREVDIHIQVRGKLLQ